MSRARRAGGPTRELQRVTVLIVSVRALRGAAPWARDLPAVDAGQGDPAARAGEAVAAMAADVAAAFYFEPELRER